jgi:hypothetical protein
MLVVLCCVRGLPCHLLTAVCHPSHLHTQTHTQVVSTFDKSSIWLVATAGMGPKQRQQLGLRLRSDEDADEGADDSDDDGDR